MRLKKRTCLIIFFLFLPLLAMAIPPVVSSKAKMALVSSFGPILRVGGNFARRIDRLGDWLKGYGPLIRASRELEHRVASLTQEVMRLREASIENERLRGLLAFKRAVAYEVIPARVIGRDSTNWYSTIIIDKGSNEGVRKDMALIVPSGLVGRVVEVSPTLSWGMLIVDPNSRVGAMVQRSRVQGVVEGSLKGRLRMKYISLDADVKKGDIIISSGMGGVFPKGMAIGEVEGVETDSGGLHLYAWVEPTVDFSGLEEVLCVVQGR